METAEVDDRLVWIEERICSSLKGNGDEVKLLFSNDQNREVFLHFCNSGESRVLFVQLPSPDSEGLEDDEDPCVSLQPPKRIMEKAIMFIKCLHASKLSREEISNEVVVTECFKQPLNHLELITREVYLPLLARGVGEQSDKMLDMLHRLLSLLQTTRGNVEGDVVLPLPSIEVLAEVAGSQARTSIVVHVLESFVVTWMKLIKSILHKDPNVAVLKGEAASSGGSRYPGPLVECHYWDHRLTMLVSLKDQISSAIVRNILRNLEQTQSSYASSFYSLQKDITKAIEDAEICIMFLNTLKPWIHRLHKSHDTDDIIRVFPPLLHVLQLIWRNCKYYNVMNNFNRLLLLLSNEVMIKSRDVVGPKVLSDPEMAYINLKTALRICASFRGCYLDYREKIEHFIKRTADKEKDYPSAGGLKMVPWPPRNASVFLQLNTFMERCNDVLELVVTIKHFNELEGAVSVDSDSKDPLLTDVNNKFIGCMEQFQKSTKDLLCFTDDDPFERSFFDFRTTILSLESSMSKVLMSTFDQCPNLMSELRVLEMFQGVSRREVVQASLKERCDAIVSSYTDELNSVAEMLTNHHRSPPQHKNMPPVTSKLCWLHALRERITWPMDKLREVAAELLEGDKGWSLRHIHGQLLQEIEQHKVETKSSWELSIPTGLHHRLKDHVMIRDDGNQLLGVNLDPSLLEVMREAHYLQHEPFNMKMPTEVKMLMRNMSEQTLHDSATKLQLVVQHYNSITQQLTDTTRLLFHNKLELTEELISHGLEEITWRSSKLQDFVADSTALISSDLHHVMNSVLERMAKIDSIIDTWMHLGGMTVFDDESGKGVPLEELQKKHEEMCDCVEAILVPSGDRIKDLVDEIFQVVEVSHDSPSWHSFLDHIDHIILTGLRSTILSALKILSDRVAQYEQGQAIPCLVKVKLGLVGSTISFTPPLDQQSALESVPEVVRRWMDDYVAMAKVMRPFSASTCETRRGCYYSLINKDPEVTATVAKICAHLETSARQCQALKRKFSEITFLWEQDVKSTFDEFLHGTFLPRPRCMSRPETVKTRPSSTQPRPKTSPSYSHSVVGSMSHKLGASMSAMMGLTDYGFLYASGSVRLMSTMRVRSRHSGMGDGDEDVKRPSIDDFDSEISIFKGIHDQIDGLDDFVSVGWIGVNMKPAKHLVCALITKWIYVYTNFLTKQTIVALDSLGKFLEETEPVVEHLSYNDHTMESLMKLMKVFNKVGSQQKVMDYKFGAIHRSQSILEKYGYPLSHDRVQFFHHVPQRWNTLKKKVSLAKQRVSPHVQSHAEIVMEELERFGKQCVDLHEEFLVSPCLDYDCTDKEAEPLITKYSTTVKGLKTIAQDLIELQDLLEETVFNFSHLSEFVDELLVLQAVRDLRANIEESHNEWLKVKWKEIINIASLKVLSELNLEQIQSLPEFTLDWDIRQRLEQSVTEIVSCLPLIKVLSSAAMRPRHWKQVLRLCARSVSHLSLNPASFVDMDFKQFIDLGLQGHVPEVEAIAARAERDVKVESAIKNFEEVWLSKLFDLTDYQRSYPTTRTETRHSCVPHTRSSRTQSIVAATATIPHRHGSRAHLLASIFQTSATSMSNSINDLINSPIPMLTKTNRIFDALEDHQVVLQVMLNSSSAGSFAGELDKWHKYFQTIEEVLEVWLEVQDLWFELEEAYTMTEVQQSLPHQAYQFALIDKQWRELMFNTSRNPNVMQLCCKADLLPSLEKMQVSLQHCSVALMHYLENRKTKFPWYYFLPLDDILNIVCHGSKPAYISSYIHKLLPSCASLTYQEQGGLITGKLLMLHSHTGEKLKLDQPVTCEGTIEVVLSNFMTAITVTIKQSLSSLVKQYIPQAPTLGSEMIDVLHIVWQQPTATQLLLIVSQLLLHNALVQSINNLTSSDQASSNEMNDAYTFFSQAIDLFSDVLRQPDRLQAWVKPEESQSGESCDQIQIPLVFDDTTLRGNSNVPESNDTPIQKYDSSHSQKYIALSVRNLIIILGYYRDVVERLISSKLPPIPSIMINSSSEGGMEPNMENSKDFHLNSIIHYSWSDDDDGVLKLDGAGCSLEYGNQFVGGGQRLILSTDTERHMFYLLKVVTDMKKFALCIGEKLSARESTLNEMSSLSGREVHVLHCSEHSTHQVLCDYVRGMAATGSWIHLHHLEQVSRSILAVVGNMLDDVITAYSAKQSITEHHHETLTLSGHFMCFSSLTTHTTIHTTLPEQILKVFHQVNFLAPQLIPILDGLLVSEGFKNSGHLTKHLLAMVNVFERLVLSSQHNVHGKSSLRLVKKLVSIASKLFGDLQNMKLPIIKVVDSKAQMKSHSDMYIQYKTGSVEKADASGPIGRTLGNVIEEDDSLLSLISSQGSFTGHVITSNVNSSGRESELDEIHYRTLEEFSLVLAAKECLFPYFELEGLEVNLFIQFITERFPGCDLYTLLAEERSMQESLLAGNPQHSAANSANQKSARGRAMLHTGEHLDSNDVRGFDDSMISSCRHRNLTPSIAFQTRIAQFIQLLQENRMVVLQGESGCGKSTLINVCSDVMSSMGHNIHLKHINCNAMRPGELLGYFCDTDHEWQEGLLPQLLTQFSMHTLHAGGHRPTMEWIVLDGSLNARQIDNLTTILSEDGTLKLADKKSIYLPSTIKLVIETDEFLGVDIPSVHMTSRDISWESMVDGWLHTSGAKLVTSYEEILKLLFHKYVPMLLNFMDEVQDVEEMDNEAKQQHQHHLKQIKHATHHMRPSNIHLVNHICIILQASLPTVRGELNDEIMERHFLYAAVWAFGGHLSPSHQILFDYWLRSKCRKQLDEELPIPEAGNVFDYYVCPETQEFKCWADDAATRTTHLASHDLQKGFPHVHWNYSAAVSYLLGLLLQQGSSVLITGTTGNGKTALVKDKLLELCSTTDYTSLHIYTNNTTSTETVWEQLSDSLQWKSGSTYIPKGGHHLICFVDDLHEAKSRDNGNCPIGELMRHHITMGNIYHPSTARAHEIPNLSFVVSCDKSYHLNNRILQHFIVLHLPEPNEESLVHTFGVILKNHFINTDRGRPVSSCQRITTEVVDKLVPLAIELHEQIPLLYLKTPKRLHYIFSIRDLVHVFWRIKMSLNSSHTTEQLLRHWHYETYWAYGAQLSSCVDRERYLELVRAFSKKYFGDTTLLPVLLEQEDMAFMPINMSTDDDDHLQSIMDDTIANKLRSYFNAHLAEYNKHNPPVSVNLYRSTLKETAHMIHVLQGPFDQGHILLIGHSDPVPFLVLSAQCCGYSLVHMSDVFSTKLLAKNSSNLDGMSAKSYRSPQFKEDLKTLFLRAGVKGEKILLVLNDTELLHLDFLTHAYEFLNDCAISYLFTAEEQAHINNSVRSDMNQAGIHFTSASAWNFFLKNICHNMRVVVTSASCDAKFQRNFKSYVSLCNRLNTVYCLEWSRMELVDVAIHHLRDHHMFSGGLQENLAHLLASIHLSVLQVTTNKHIQHPHVNNELYEYFVERFCHTVQRQHAHNKEMSDELSRALDRISSTRKEASKLGDQLGRETNTLDERKYASSKLLTQIGQDVTITSEHAKLINKQRKRIKHLQKVLPDYKHAYELVLADTDKMLQSTKSLVREMGQEQLTELRAISKPSQDIEDIFATIIMIVKSPQADISWTKGAKRLMANLDRFQEMLESFDQQDVSSESLLASLEHYTIKTSFTPDYLSQKYTNKAVTLLCRWVQGVMSYHSNLQTKVRPLQAKVTSMKNSLTENISRLKVMEEKYEILDERLIGLHKAFEQASVQKSTQLEKVNGMKKQLSNLEEFQATLSGIHEHWIEQLSNYQSAHIDYIGSDALSTALAVYLGPLSPELRLEFIDHHWSKCLKERGIELNWSSTEKVLIPSVTDEVGQSVFSLDHRESPAAPPTTGESPAAPPTTGESPAVPLTTGKSPVATPTTDDNNDTDVTNDDKMDDGKEVMDKSHLSTTSESTGTSYLDLCSLVSSTLTERNLLEHWSAMGYDAYFILDLAIFQSSWGRWPLGFDPEGMMSAYVKLKHEKDDLLFLDYRNRSPSFFLSLEHAILHGQPVMMHHVDTMRFDPSLITLLDCNNTSSAGERVIRYCSRKMHSHPSFHLYLSTTSYPVQVAPSLAALVTLTDFTPKHQSLCSTLLQAAYSVIWPEDPVLELSQEVVKLKMEIAHIDANLLKVIGDSDVKDIILFGAGKIKNLVEINQQAASTIDSLMVKIRAHNDQIRSLTPLTDHAAHIFTLLQYVGPRFQFHLSEFLALFKVDVALYSAKLRECLADHHENDDTATQDDVAGEGMVEGGMAGQEDNVTVVQKDNVVKSISTQKAIDDQLEKVLKTLNHTILEKASRSLSQDAWLSLALSMEELPSDKVGQLRENYGDITVPSLEQIIDEMMSSKSVQPRILIGEITGQRHITETTRQLMTRLLTAHQSDRTVTVIDVNAEQEADAKEALKHPTTNCICFTNIELASHNLLQLVEHREEPLQANGCLLILCTSSLTGLSDSLLKTAQVIMLANLGKKINIPASDEERHQAAQHLAVHHEIRVVSSSSSGLSEASSQPEGLMQSLSFCKEYTPPTVECPQLDDFLSMLTTNVAVLSSINIDDATLAGDAGKAVMGYALYQDIEKYNELIEKIIEETDKLSSSVIGGMANVPDTLLASVQALEDGDTPDSWLLDDEPKKLSDYFKDLQHQFDNLQDVITNIS